MDGILSFGSMNQKRLLPHKNKGMEIVYVEKGRLCWQVDGRKEQLYPESVFFTLPWQSHGSVEEHDPGNMIHWVLFKLDRLYASPTSHFHFHPALAFSPQESGMLSRIFCQSKSHTWKASPRIAWLISTAIEEIKNPGIQSEAYVWGLLKSLIVEFARLISSDVVQRNNVTEAAQHVENFIHMLSHVCDQEWTLDAMANHCELKRTQFSVILKKVTGDSPMTMTYLHRVRINKAKNMLLDRKKARPQNVWVFSGGAA